MTHFNHIRHKLLPYSFVILVFAVSCKKFIDIAPPDNQIISETAFNNDATATSAVAGIYSEMMNNSQQFCNGLNTLFSGMSSDELSYYSPGYRDEFISNQISLAGHSYISQYFWQPAYKYIYAANLCLEGIEKSTSLTLSLRSTLKGEAKFIRAFCYFHLVNLFGDVPLVLSSDYKANASKPRSGTAEVYAQIIGDLKDAQQLLSTAYTGTERVRPNKWTATALLARVYLYNKDWANAEAAASSVISSGEYSLVSNLNNVFLKGSQETIWQLMPVNPTVNTWEANAILPALSSTQPTYLITGNLLGAFEAGDQRRNAWVASRVYLGQTLYYPNKYKVYGNSAPLTEYYVVFRLAELILVRAEARAHQNNFVNALADLNSIRNRSSLPNLNISDLPTSLLAIEQERRIEFFSEWGHRWYDLKRANRADAVLGILKPATWQTTDALWPIPNDQILLNNSLIQNPGY